MKLACGLIQDLLPLYQDEVCSEESRRAVEEHLGECADCRQMAERLRDREVDGMLRKERDSVLERHEKKEREKTYMVGMVSAGVLLVPTVVCLICNLAIGHGLDWFFIVLSSMLVVASLLVVPFVVRRERALATILAFTVSLVLLLLVCCIYTRGRWFFVAAVPTVFGLSVVFAPYVVMRLRLPKPLSQHRGLLTLAWDSLWLYLVIVTCGLFVRGGSDYWRLALSITSYCLLPVWGVFLFARYVRMNRLVKSGLIVMLAGAWTAFGNDGIAMLTGLPSDGGSLFTARLSEMWRETDVNVFSSDILLLLLLASLIVGAILILLGVLREKKKKGEE